MIPDSRMRFRIEITKCYNFDPNGLAWTGLGDALGGVHNHSEFRGLNWADCVTWFRELAVEKGLTREDRIAGPNHVDMTEGYFGLIRK